MSVVPAKEILKQLNIARTKPQLYAGLVQKQIDSFIDNFSMPLMKNCNYRTNQGKKAWQEAYKFLMKQKPLNEFQLNQGLTFAADDHVADLAQNNLFGHTSSNGDSMTERIQFRCGKTYGTWGENVGSSFDVPNCNHAVQTILQLIIDDGVPNRGHRNAVFSPDYKYIGASSRKCGDKIITVINYHSTSPKTVFKGVKNIESINKQYANKQKDDKDDFNKKFANLGFSNKEDFGNNKNFGSGKMKIIQKKQDGGKKVVSSSTKTSTKTFNGKTTKVAIKKLVYSDGTEEQIIQESTY